MASERRILALARHGFTLNGPDGLSLGSLTADSVQQMYSQGFPKHIKSGTSTDRTFVLYSDKARTLNTARARIAGIRNLTPAPLREKDLEGLTYENVKFIRDERLSYENLKTNYSERSEPWV